MSKKPAFKAFRLISLALGSALSYSFIKKSIAPGQISLKEQAKFLKQYQGRHKTTGLNP